MSIFNCDKFSDEFKISQAEKHEEDKKYLTGGQNNIIRFYFYLMNGLQILNEFRNSQIKIENFPEIILRIKEQFTEFEVQRQTLQTK